VLNVDLAPTFAEVAGIVPPEPVEGVSLVPLLEEDPGVSWRTDFLIEHSSNATKYCAVRSQDHVYVRYKSGEEELYNLATDPYQLRNRADGGQAGHQLRKSRHRLKELCRPRPPGVRL